MFFGLDVHKRFIQVCTVDAQGNKCQEFRIDATSDAISSFADTLGSDDHVVLEATFHTWAIWAILKPHASRVVVANPMQVKAIAHARIKTDKVDAHILAQLLRVDFIPEVCMPEEKAWELRQLVSHRRLLNKERTATKNATRAIINRKLLHCPKVDLFGTGGRKWLMAQNYTDTERFILENIVSLLDDIECRIAAVDEQLKAQASIELEARLLMTIPGINIVTAVGLLAEIGDITRFSTPDKLAAYFGLVPRISQSADKCYHGRITKTGRSHARWLAVEAAQSIAMNSAPMAASYHRLRRKKPHNVAVTALARKLVVLIWHILKNREPYRYAPVARTRRKLRAVTPEWQRSENGTKPTSIEEAYIEHGLPLPRPASDGERRAADKNQRTMDSRSQGEGREF